MNKIFVDNETLIEQIKKHYILNKGAIIIIYWFVYTVTCALHN